MKKVYKPVDGIPSFYQHYMDLLPDDGELLQHLENILLETEQLVSELSEEVLAYRYSEGKWTIKDIILHLADCERVIIYRAMRIGRGDKTDLPGFNENLLVQNANAGDRSIKDILNELSVLRKASIAFIETLDDTSLNRTGTANKYPIAARLLVNHVYGHHRHHLNIIKEKYLVQ